ncbi:hypothetical protein KP509_17G013700 [Ceratopteris richardii]|uniref:Uncharacterized protein n=1 Tax=Ceratopteris richardii TaxID=49495 RepID=A0A8T2SU65_CERRI|nr:hypothetical protein KP509_17G013700 [Ceratopteris richardii]
MATLTRGVSFRRQGSSGRTWGENWDMSNEVGLVPVKAKSGPLLQQTTAAQISTPSPSRGPPPTRRYNQRNSNMKRSHSSHDIPSLRNGYASCLLIGKPSPASITSAMSVSSSSITGKGSGGIVAWLRKAFVAKSEF